MSLSCTIDCSTGSLCSLFFPQRYPHHRGIIRSHVISQALVNYIMRALPHVYPRIIYNQSHHFRIADILLAFHISIAIFTPSYHPSNIYHVLICSPMVSYNLIVPPTSSNYETHQNGSILSPDVYFFLVQCTIYTVTRYELSRSS